MKKINIVNMKLIRQTFYTKLQQMYILNKQGQFYGQKSVVLDSSSCFTRQILLQTFQKQQPKKKYKKLQYLLSSIKIVQIIVTYQQFTKYTQKKIIMQPNQILQNNIQNFDRQNNYYRNTEHINYKYIQFIIQALVILYYQLKLQIIIIIIILTILQLQQSFIFLQQIYIHKRNVYVLCALYLLYFFIYIYKQFHNNYYKLLQQLCIIQIVIVYNKGMYTYYNKLFTFIILNNFLYIIKKIIQKSYQKEESQICNFENHLEKIPIEIIYNFGQIQIPILLKII
eukprot:TRINITY_DN36583_c0_g1_i1.p1 TRINITY_DN36583_c0_g1~~TRINITY_DN36583_c0_g1_i1.p1  ORF type:complete len:283 (-),score=-17.84 TRINITY_DN36583_c0_g1_i1:555-1403(-)